MINFKPGQNRQQTYSQAVNNTNTSDLKDSKYTFKYLLHSLTGKRPEFLTNFIYEANPEISKTIEILFDILYSTFTSLLTSFTELMFTKLNYKHIFSSHSNILLYTISNRINIALNLARLHLHLNYTYKTINYRKFAKDLNITPIRMQLHYNFLIDQTDKPLIIIKNDHKFNIYIDINIPQTYFLNTYRIPSLKKCNHSFEK